MKDHIIPYKERLADKIGKYMELPVNDHTAMAIKSMTECWETIDGLEKEIASHNYSSEAALSLDDAKAWVNGMENVNGSHGEHWTVEQTTAVAESIGVVFDHISKWCWWATMNMMYSDYYNVAEKNGVNSPSFYAEMAKAFLFDPDGPAPRKKLAAYYNYIVKKH